MSRLIIHVGPAKCGSSTIQLFLAHHPNAWQEHLRYHLMDPQLIPELNLDQPDAAHLQRLQALLEKQLRDCDVCVLSHEFLFQNPLTIGHICRAAVALATDIRIVGYARRQSGALTSAYRQWLFRKSRRRWETSEGVRKLGIEPDLFSGVERHLIACIADDFYSARQLSTYQMLDWHQCYRRIDDLVADTGTTIACGVLPNRAFPFDLIPHFGELAGLRLRDGVESVTPAVVNRSFDPELVEAIDIAVSLDRPMPGPHADNPLLERLSEQLRDARGAPPPAPSQLQQQMDNYVDAYYHPSNLALCRAYGPDPAYFAVSERQNKRQILKLIKAEARRRRKDGRTVIARYRNLSAHLAALAIASGKAQQP